MYDLTTSNCEMVQPNYAASASTRKTDMRRQVGDDADWSRVCSLLKRRLPSTTQRDFGFPLRCTTLVMSESNTSASVGRSARGVGTKAGMLSSKVYGKPSRSFEMASIHASQSPRQSTVSKDVAPGSGTTAGTFASWSPSLLASKTDVGAEDAATVAVGVCQVDDGPGRRPG